MLPLIASHTRLYDPVLGSTYKIVQSADTLGRLTKLNDFLNPTKILRSKAIKELQNLGTSAKKELSTDNISLDGVKKTMKEGLTLIKAGVRSDKNLLDVYEKTIDTARTKKELNKCISKLLKDTVSVSALKVQKTNKGQNGPTHLISYTRSSKKNILPRVRNYVVKWSNWNEICSSRFYDVISQTLSSQTFVVPKIAALDFDKKIHEQGDLTSSELEGAISTHLKKSFLDIVGKSIQTHDAQLMLMEKVEGSNLIDFAQTKYQDLTAEEKRDLFQKMGNLAMLDFLIGNTDRLIQTRYDAKTKQYQLEDITANLGNLMIDWFPDEGKLPQLYAIDNGIKTELIANKTEKNAYNQFLQKFENLPMASLAETMIRSLVNSFQDISEELSENSKQTLTQTLAKFEPILKDLKNSEEPKIALIKGLEEMLRNFKEVLLPFWNSKDAEKLKDHLKKNHPALLDAVTERFKIFNFIG